MRSLPPAPEFIVSAALTAAWPEVRAAAAAPVLDHHDPRFLDIFQSARAKAGQVLGTRNEIILVQGKAVLGLEAAARALTAPGTAVLSLVTGVFGAKLSGWLRDCGAKVHELAAPYNDVVTPEAVAGFLDAHREVRLLTVVHSETPSGTRHDLAGICSAAREYGVLTLADCVSSVGGMPVDVDGWGIDVCVAAPQKCLGGLSGISVVSVSDQAWEMAERNPQAPRSSFLSLLDWHGQPGEEARFPHTPVVSDVAALEKTFDLALDAGSEVLAARHELAAKVCRAGARAMGLDLWPARDEIASPCVTAVTVPPGLDHETVRDHARNRYRVQLSSGMGAGNLVRIGHMGPAASGMFAAVGLMALGRSLADLGVPVRLGAGLEAALDVLSASGAPAGGPPPGSYRDSSKVIWAS